MQGKTLLFFNYVLLVLNFTPSLLIFLSTEPFHHILNGFLISLGSNMETKHYSSISGRILIKSNVLI